MGLTTDKSEPIMNNLNILFYSSRIAGVIPFGFGDYFYKKILKRSVMGTIWCIFILILHCVQYHVALCNFKDKRDESANRKRINELAVTIGFFIVYMEPFMMLVDILAAILNQKKLTLCLGRLTKVDDSLAKENVFLKNEGIRRCTVMFLILTGFGELSLVFFNFLEFEISDSLLLQIYWWICNSFPNITNSICRIWFITLVFTIQERFKVINKCIQDIEFSFKNTKSESVTSISKDFNNHRQLLKRKKSHGFKNNKIHIIDPTSPAYSKPEDHPSPIKTISNHLPTFKDLDKFPIDNKLDKKLIEICKIHDELCEISKMVNQMFSFQILLTMAYGFMVVTAQFYFLYCGLVGQAIPILFRSAESILISSIYISYTCLKCFSIIFVSWKTTLEAQETGVFLHKVANAIDESHFYQIINHLSLKLLNNKLIFTACGFFDLDMTTIYAIMGAVTSYLIILVQFNLATGNGTNNTTNGTSLI